jgi:hypothetical protein
MGYPGAPVRIALIGCSGLLGDIITQTIAAEPNLDVVAQLATVDTDAELPFLDPDLDVDLVLWNNADERWMAHWLRSLCRGYPRVLATLGDAKSASLWELVPHRTELGDVSPRTLMQAILETGAGQP